MENIEDLHTLLESLLLRHFWIVPARTNRQDQWYKRTYQSWKNDNSNDEPLILSPKTSRMDWGSDLQSLAAVVARTIRQKTEERYQHNGSATPPSAHKLFSDDVFDIPLGILGPDYQQKSPLKPAMQRSSYWTTFSPRDDNERDTHRRAIKTLLACEQIDMLCYLARQPGTQIKTAAFVESPVYPGSSRRTNMGWVGLIDEILEILMALTILNSYPESLPLQTAYRAWVPFVFARSSAAYCNSTIAEKLQSIFPDRRETAITGQNFRDAIDRCFRVLVASDALLLACNTSAIDWEQCVINTFLYFVGFESWNREREGQGYLGCDLNMPKDDAWLKKATGFKPEVTMDEKTSRVNYTKTKDPLYLHEAKREDVSEVTEEQKELQNELDDLEAQELAYGLKRSIKYEKKNVVKK